MMKSTGRFKLEKGSVLIIVLALLLALAISGIALMSRIMVKEQVSRFIVDNNFSFQVAEAVLAQIQEDPELYYQQLFGGINEYCIDDGQSSPSTNCLKTFTGIKPDKVGSIVLNAKVNITRGQWQPSEFSGNTTAFSGLLTGYDITVIAYGRSEKEINQGTDSEGSSDIGNITTTRLHAFFVKSL